MSDYGLRHDGSQKSSGYFGELTNKHGDVMTEFTVGVNIDGQEMDIPTLVPTLSKQELDTLRNLDDGAPIPDPIVQAAIDHAMYRRSVGKSVFADKKDKAQAKAVRKALGL